MLPEPPSSLQTWEPPGFRPICRTDTTSLKTFCWDMTMQKDISKTPIIWEPLSAGLPTAFIRHPFLSKALPICWRKTTEKTPITADYPAFTRRYGNGNGQIPASVSFSTLRTWKEDIREMYRRKWNINSRKPTN